ncbi:MAG: peptide chain release factor N(5)-glutamine methyltransferase [Gemmatimonadaceae bacterium]|nr:peptide chain release factor N(5)-glutamine methyltransferase [Gemmatimonadaceae bacterium]
MTDESLVAWTRLASDDDAGSLRCADLVAAVAATLGGAGVDTARQEARDLVAACCDEPRFWPTLNPELLLPARVVAHARRAAERRARGAPFAYAVGKAAFRHLTLAVDERVLIPRPETEQLVEEILRRTGGGHGVAADIGTGSGAIALALAAEGGFTRVVGTDVSQDALDVAGGNAAALAGELRARVEWRLGTAVAPLLGERLTVLASNPPYIAYDEARDLPASVRDWEPAQALFAGDEGMAVIAAIVAGAADLLVPGGLLALEVDSRRADRAAALALAAGFPDAAVVQDLAGRDRFVFATRPADPAGAAPDSGDGR